MLVLALTGAGVLLAPAGPALAHNQLVSAKPARDATLREAPTAVTLAFLQRLDPAFTTVAVSDSGKRRVAASAPVVKAKTASVRLDEALDNGAYTVAYRVVSVDGHTVQGSYTFTVADPNPPSAAASAAPSVAGPAVVPSVTVTPVAVAAPADSGVPAGLLAGIGAAGMLLAGTAAFLYVARRRRAAARP
ncbi:copper resistance protein CopC [Actinoplanes sp. NPDC049599]|uniref:copper resistance protein CopC n=1 Tax=Actinoplanes sp. NPDC049599 TaxID=3363903 RepID=UPI0037AE4137